MNGTKWISRAMLKRNSQDAIYHNTPNCYHLDNAKEVVEVDEEPDMLLCNSCHSSSTLMMTLMHEFKSR